ncbi:MAG TPA: NADPH-dependent F420 reductase [Candidatus Limnocylindria bacterium]|nr:NADPH-dependent F420 reductase [Candidatus Limnocylindria bacterium]
MKIAVIGSGNVGAALGEALVRAGHEIVFGVRGGAAEKPPVTGSTTNDVRSAILASEIVLLAVPWGAVPDVLGQVKDWSPKVLIDCTNPLGAGLELVLGLSTSGGEQVASLAKGARVVKAFNTTGFGNMKNPKYGGRGVTMLYATDDSAAASIAEQVIRDVGFEPEFAGPLRQARYLEPFAALWISMTNRLGRDFAFTLVRR